MGLESARLRVRDLTPADAEEIARWHYDGPWQVYDVREGEPLPDAASSYFAVSDDRDGTLIGFMCIGAEARVPGLDGAEGIVDIGVGMRADLVGRGFGTAFGAAVLDEIRQRYGPVPLRAVILAWNERSLRLARHLGFRDAGLHTCFQDGQQVTYVVLMADPLPPA
jgi:ribosomal-protein-alanine N-acetyltransferase